MTSASTTACCVGVKAAHSRTTIIARHSLSSPASNAASVCGSHPVSASANPTCRAPCTGDSRLASATCAVTPAIPAAWRPAALPRRQPGPRAASWTPRLPGSSRDCSKLAERACSRATRHPSKSPASEHARARARHACATCSCEDTNAAVSLACAAATADFTRSNAAS